MNVGRIVIFGSICFITGAVTGLLVGYKYRDKEYEESEKTIQERQKQVEKIAIKEGYKEAETKDPDHPIIVSGGPAKIAMPGKPGINYAAYAKKVQEIKDVKKEMNPNEPAEVTEDDLKDIEPEYETYEERQQREQNEINEQLQQYEKKKGDKIDVLGNRPIDNEWPDVSYEEEELLYFMQDDVLTDEDGTFVDGHELLGDKLYRFGWFKNGEEAVWVRNNKLHRDFHVVKYNTDYQDYFGDNDAPEDE